MHIYIYVTGPGKTGLIYTCSYYGMYLLFCICYPKSASFIEFLMDLCTFDDISHATRITDKKLLHFKLSKSGQILCVDKTCFPRPGHIYILPHNTIYASPNSEHDSITEGPPSLHHSTICCTMESDRNTTGPTHCKT